MDQQVHINVFNLILLVIVLFVAYLLIQYMQQPVTLKQPVKIKKPEESIKELESIIQQIKDEQVYVISRLRSAIKSNNTKLATDAIDIYNQLSYQESLVRNKVYNYQLTKVSDTIKTLTHLAPGVTTTEEQRSEYNKQINSLIDTFNNYATYMPVIGTQKESYTDDDINKIIMQSEAAIKQNDINTSQMNNKIIDLTKTFNDKIASIIIQNQTISTATAMSKTDLDIIKSTITELKTNQVASDNIHKVLQKAINDANVTVDYIKDDLQLQVTNLTARVSVILSESAKYVDNTFNTLNTTLNKRIDTLTSTVTALTTRVTTSETNFTRLYNYCTKNIPNILSIDNTDASIGTIVATTAASAQINTLGKVNGLTIWMLCDGRSCAGTAYAASGRTVVPDLRGVFLRGFNNGVAGNNILPNNNGQSQYNPDNTAIGSIQVWANAAMGGQIGPISETFGTSRNDAVYDNITNGNFMYKTKGYVVRADNTPNGTDISECGILQYNTARAFPYNTNLYETRPTNMAVNYIIKVNSIALIAY